MKKNAVTFKNAPPAVGPYSQGFRAGDLLFLSGQLPIDPETHMLETGPIEKQARRILDTVRVMLSEQDLTLNQVVKVSVFLKDMNSFPAVNAVYAEYFTQPAPARECVEVARLPGDAEIEISLIAAY
ncbi:reactive intermediate/imine deaminase [bacterium]|nr:reactive intermediate/imine deaminase [candidate division CSSED10-310 bacterium]